MVIGVVMCIDLIEHIFGQTVRSLSVNVDFARCINEKIERNKRMAKVVALMVSCSGLTVPHLDLRGQFIGKGGLGEVSLILA